MSWGGIPKGGGPTTGKDARSRGNSKQNADKRGPDRPGKGSGKDPKGPGRK